MKVLLFGATGQVGQEIGRHASRFSVEIDPVDREQVDLSKAGQAAAHIERGAYGGVINAAAYTAVDAAESDTRAATAVNADAPGEMAMACARAGLPLIHYSTDYVFDGSATQPLVETDRTGPLGVYGRTKLGGEDAVRASGCAHVIIRLSWVFSAHGRNFVKTMLRLGREQGQVRVVADQVGTPTPAADAACAGLTALNALARHPACAGTYHFAGEPPLSWAAFADAIFERAGLDVTVTPISTSDYPTLAKRPAYSGLSGEAFARAFAMPAADWRAGLADVIDELAAKAC